MHMYLNFSVNNNGKTQIDYLSTLPEHYSKSSSQKVFVLFWKKKLEAQYKG